MAPDAPAASSDLLNRITHREDGDARADRACLEAGAGPWIVRLFPFMTWQAILDRTKHR